MNYVIKQTGIMFQQDMIRAYIQGRKTQTRRTKGLQKINEAPDDWHLLFSPRGPGIRFVSFSNKYEPAKVIHVNMPYGGIGDQLYFKETWKMWERDSDCKDFLHYRADDAKVDPTWWTKEDWTRPDPVWVGRFDKWQSSMFMPRICARFSNIPIKSVSVERLHDITFNDAYSEGCPKDRAMDGIAWYRDLWDSLNGKKLPWTVNPWVWVYEFPKRTEGETL